MVAGQDSVLLQGRDSVEIVEIVKIVGIVGIVEILEIVEIVERVESVGSMLPVKMAAVGVGLVAGRDIKQSATLVVSLV